MARKPRSDAKLLSLPREQQEKLAAWLTLENKSYAQAVELCERELGVQTSVGAMQHFYSAFAASWRYCQAAGEADSFAALLEGKFDQAAIKKARQLAFEAMSSPQPDLKAAKTLMKIVGDSAKLSLQERQLALDFEKFKQQVKTEVEKGLDALHAEVKGSAEALQLFEKLKAAVLKSVEGAT